MKTKISLVFLGGLLIVALGFYIWLWREIPHDLISALKTGYVENNSITQQRPIGWIAYEELDQKIHGAFVVNEDNLSVVKYLADNLFIKGNAGGDIGPFQNLKELLIVKALDKELSKEKIWEIYLNMAQFGVGISGLETASKEYFNKKAGALAPKEAAFLATILSHPAEYQKSFQENFKGQELTEDDNTKIANILERMVHANYMTPDEVQKLKEIPLPFEKKELEKIVPPSKKESPKKLDKKEIVKKPRPRPNPRKRGNEDDDYRLDTELLLDDAPDMSQAFDESELLNVEAEFVVE